MDKNNITRAGTQGNALDSLPSAMKSSAGRDGDRSGPMGRIVRIFVITVTAALFVGSALQAVSGQRDLAVLFALAAPLGISALGFARAGHNEPAIALVCTVLTTVVTLVLIVNPLGVHDVALTAYGGVLLVGALLLSRRAYIALASLIFMAASTAFIVDLFGFTRSRIGNYTNWAQFAEFLLLLGVFGVLGRVAVEILLGSLVDADRARNDDPLTGFANRQGFFETASARLRGRPNDQAVLVIADLEGFRRVNVVIGHRAADNVLIEVARRIREANGNQLAGRLGDDEFAILAPAADEAAAAAYARKIHDALQFEYLGVSVRTCTGYARFPRDAHGLESLLLAAENSLTNARHEKDRFGGPADRI